MDVNLNPKNIEQYVGKLILLELRRQNEEILSLKKELAKLKQLADKIEHCSNCYTPESQQFSGVELYICYTCGKTVCNQECCKYWLLEYPKLYCSQECYDADR